MLFKGPRGEGRSMWDSFRENGQKEALQQYKGKLNTASMGMKEREEAKEVLSFFGWIVSWRIESLKEME